LLKIALIVLCRLTERPTADSARSIRKLLEIFSFHPSSSVQAAPQGFIDVDATSVLRRFHGVLLETYTPLATVADGNCAYRAVSLAMFGTEEQHSYA